MQRVTAKICGLSTPETVGAAVRHGASHVGFVFFAKSPRNVTPEQVGAMAQALPDHIGKVAVLVDPDDALIDEVVRTAKVDVLQLHGNETPDRLAGLRKRHPAIALWKAIPIRVRADLNGSKAYADVADLMLYDAKTPEGTLPGGMGLRFDWTLLDGFLHPQRWALSGGIDVGNVERAASMTGTSLIDTSSGVESAPGIKNVDKIAAFLQRISLL